MPQHPQGCPQLLWISPPDGASRSGSLWMTLWIVRLTACVQPLGRCGTEESVDELTFTEVVALAVALGFVGELEPCVGSCGSKPSGLVSHGPWRLLGEAPSGDGVPQFVVGFGF